MQLEWQTLFIRLLSVMKFTSNAMFCRQTWSQLTVSMVLMESYFFCASVRLGVIVISAFALQLKSVIIMYVVSANGLHFTLSLISAFDKNISYRASYYLVRDAIYWLDRYPQTVSILLQLYSICHVLSCAIAAYGAFKLKKRFAIPLAIFEFIYIVQIVTIFTLFLRILRHFLSISNLILLTIVATFYSMLVVYDFFALVAFEQILRLVLSKNYQDIYGPDPLNPIIQQTTSGFNNTVKLNDLEHPIIVYVTPAKWWQVENLKKNSITEDFQVEEMHKYFQSHELLPKVVLTNGLKKYTARHKF